uniref:Uncharacterized protein n=1 Tax=Panthera leo TaxID=9689 RepID=A0A8C8XV87_PANLE
MHRPRCFFSKVGLLSKRGLLPWCAIKPPVWSQLFLGRACKGNFMHMIGKKCQRGQKRQKKPKHSYIPFTSVLFSFICPVMPLLPCLLQPVINGYQNKSTFSTVGHYLGTWRGQLNTMTSINNKPRAERRGKV